MTDENASAPPAREYARLRVVPSYGATHPMLTRRSGDPARGDFTPASVAKAAQRRKR